MATYDVYNRMEPSQIHLARPGKRKLGELNSIKPESCSLSLNCNNTSTLEFEVDKYLNGEPSNFYDRIVQNNTLEVTGFGWFLINTTPEVNFDGENEYKRVNAESLEIQLQNYDLVGFKVNCGTSDSWEMMAPDNTYEDEYGNLLPRDQVLFYRDTEQYDALINAFKSTDQSLSSLQSLLYTYPCILSSWRIDFDMDTFIPAVEAVIRDLPLGESSPILESYLTNPPKTSDEVKSIVKVFPEILKYISITIILDKGDESTEYSIANVLSLETDRMNKLSLMWLILNVSETPWKVGSIDNYIDTETGQRLADMVGKFDVDSQDVYSFLTQTVSEYFQCLFDFDTYTCSVNAKKIANYGEDTHIFLSYHNVQKSLTQSGSDKLYTVYRVGNNDGLDIRLVNYMDDTIFDYSYVMNTDNFDQAFIDKFQAWVEARETNRPAFIELSKDLYAKQEAADEIYYRVPDDGADTDQYESLSIDQLNQMKDKYTAEKAGYESLYVDDEGNFDLSKLQASPDWVRYQLIVNVILPNIDTELSNRNVSSSDDKTELDESYRLDFDTYGDLYGVQELEHYLEQYKNSIEAHEDNGTNVPGREGDEWHAKQYADYLKVKSAYESCSRVLAERKQEYEEAKSLVEVADNAHESMANSMKMSAPEFGFTQSELELFRHYYSAADYINDNIVVTSLDTSADKIDKAKKLFDYAVEELSAACRPQYHYVTDQDNILAIPEFRDWHDQLKIGNFIRITTGEHTQAKLRLITITLNPLTLENDLEFDFSNMIQYKSKRNDFSSILDSSMSAQKNQITSNFGSSGNNGDITVDSNLIYQLLRNSTFTGYMNGMIAGAVSADEGRFEYLLADHIQAISINVGQIIGDKGEFNEFFTKYLDADMIVAGSGNFKELAADIANIETLLSGTVGAGEVTTIHLTSQNVTIDDAVIKELIAKHISVADLDAHAASAELITLISQNGDPSIAFFGSTQQFYDSDGNVRVQIGQDATGDFNFIIRGADGTTALFDETGVKKDAIADGMIINDMLGDKSVTKRNMDWTGISEGVDENGNPTWDIANIYMNGEQFGAQYTTFVNSSNSKFTELDSSISNLSDMVESIELVGEQVFTESDGVISPETITIDTIRKNGATVSKWYIDGVENTEYVSADKNSITIPSSFMANKKSVLIKVECADTAKYDVMSLYRVTDGSDAVTVILTSSAGNMFKPGSASTTTLSCAVYKGSEQIVPNSYAWYVYHNDTWTNLNLSSDSIEVNISDLSGIRNYKCVVDV